MGQSLFALDVCVLVASLTYIDLRRMMYTLVCSFVFSRVVNFIQDGGYSARGIIIMTQHPDEISSEIMKTMDRGVTYLQTQGAYSKKKAKPSTALLVKAKLLKSSGSLRNMTSAPLFRFLTSMRLSVKVSRMTRSIN